MTDGVTEEVFPNGMKVTTIPEEDGGPLAEVLDLRNAIYYGLPSITKAECDRLSNRMGGPLAAAMRERSLIREDLRYLKSVFEGNVAYPQNGPLASAVRRLTEHLGA